MHVPAKNTLIYSLSGQVISYSSSLAGNGSESSALEAQGFNAFNLQEHDLRRQNFPDDRALNSYKVGKSGTRKVQ